MSKKLLVGIFATFVLALMLSSFASAYYYNYYPSGNYGGDNYDSFSYHSARVSGSGPYVTARTTDYDRTTQKYWDGNSWVDRTVYVRETRETPSYPSYGYQPSGYYGNYNNYYNSNDYTPWYQKYWSNSPAYSSGYCYNCYGQY